MVVYGVVFDDGTVIQRAYTCSFGQVRYSFESRDASLMSCFQNGIYALAGWIGFLLVAAACLAFAVRNVVLACQVSFFTDLLLSQPRPFNESRRLAVAVYSATFCALVLVPVCMLCCLSVC